MCDSLIYDGMRGRVMKLQKLMCVILIASCIAITGCGNQQNKNTQATEQVTTSEHEIVMYEEYADIPDFGKFSGIESNSEKEQVMSTVVKSGLLKVYDVPENQKTDVESWEEELVKNGFESVDQEDNADGRVTTYQSKSTNETIVLSFSKSTKDDGYVMVIAMKEDATVALPTVEDANIGSIIQGQNYIQNDGWYLSQDNWIYGLTWNDNGDGFLAKIRTDGSDYTKLLNVPIAGLFIDNGYIYGVKDEGDQQGIYKVRTSGEEGGLIVNVNEPVIQFESGHIYFSTEKYSQDVSHTEQCHLYRCNLDGSGIEEVLPKRVFCWYVFGDLILYQDDLDNESLHLYNMVTQEDKKINDQVSYCPIYDGSYIYYASPLETQAEYSNIWRMNVDGSENQKLSSYNVANGLAVYNDYIYFANVEDNYRMYRVDKAGNNLTQISQDKNCSNFYFLGDVLFYVSYDNEGYVDKAIMCNSDGSNASKIELNQW